MPKGGFPRITRGRTTWTNVEQPRASDIARLARDVGLDEAHARALAEPSARSRLFEADRYTLLIIVHPIFHAAQNDVSALELDIIITPTTLVTIHRGRLMPVSILFSDTAARKAPPMRGTAALLVAILHELATSSYVIFDELSERSDRIEQRILTEHRNLVASIVRMQTNLVDMKKLFENQTELLDRWFDTLSPSTQRAIRASFTELTIHQREIRAIVAAEIETVTMLHRAHETRVSERTNALIRALTIVSLLILPATLMAGIFGMNASYPWILGARNDFAMIVSIMVASALGVLWFVRSRKW